MAAHSQVSLPLPVLPEGWSAEKDFTVVGSVSAATQRSLEPVGPHFLAHARRARHKRTFSEDDRIQAQENVKKVEDDDLGEISEAEDPMMLARDAKDWKVFQPFDLCHEVLLTPIKEPRSLRRPRSQQIQIQGYRGTNQARPPKEGLEASPRQEGRSWFH
jgi:hypothetical protein